MCNGRIYRRATEVWPEMRGVAKFIPFCVLGDRSSNRRAIAKLSPENRNLARNARGVTNIVFARIGQAIVKQSLSHRRVTGN